MINEVGPTFPFDVWKEIVKHSKSHFVALACVNRQFEILIKTFVTNNPPKGCFGLKEWKNCGANLAVVLPIPLKMYQDFDEEHQILTFIPKKINNQHLTLSSIDQFVCNYTKSGKSNYLYPLNDCSIYDGTVEKFKSHWVVLSKTVLPETMKESFDEQQRLVKAHGYEIPNLIDVVVSLLMHNINANKNLFDSAPKAKLQIFTRVQEKNLVNVRIVVGNFFYPRLYISIMPDFPLVNTGILCQLKSI